MASGGMTRTVQALSIPGARNVDALYDAVVRRSMYARHQAGKCLIDMPLSDAKSALCKMRLRTEHATYIGKATVS